MVGYYNAVQLQAMKASFLSGNYFDMTDTSAIELFVSLAPRVGFK